MTLNSDGNPWCQELFQGTGFPSEIRSGSLSRVLSTISLAFLSQNSILDSSWITLPDSFRDFSMSSSRDFYKSSFRNFVPENRAVFYKICPGFLFGFLPEFLWRLRSKFLLGFIQKLLSKTFPVIRTSFRDSYRTSPIPFEISPGVFSRHSVEDSSSKPFGTLRMHFSEFLQEFFPGLLPGFLGHCAVFWCFFPGFLQEWLLRSSTRFLSDTFSGDWNLSGLLSSGIAYLKIWLELLPWDSTRSVPVNSPRVSHGTSPIGYLGISPRIFTELPSGFIPGVFRVIFLRDFYRMHHRFPVVIAAKINPGIS